MSYYESVGASYQYVFRGGRCVSVSDATAADKPCPSSVPTDSKPGVFGTAVDYLKQGLNFYGQTQADKATAELARAQAGGGQAASGFPIVPVAIIGGVGLVAFLLLRK